MADAKTHRTALVVIPPDDLWPPVQAIRRAHDRHFERWMPHVTLLYPFRPKEAFEALLPELCRACQGVEPFDVTLAEFRFFHHRRESHTLYLAPEPGEAVANLQAALAAVAPDCDDTSRHPDGFTPHLSVGQVQGRASTSKLLETLRTAWQPVIFTVREVCLIWRNDPPDDLFRVSDRVALGTRK